MHIRKYGPSGYIGLLHYRTLRDGYRLYTGHSGMVTDHSCKVTGHAGMVTGHAGKVTGHAG